MVIAVIEGGGLNVLHQDFSARGPLPRVAGIPPATEIKLPTSGSFEQRVTNAQRGPLGSLQPGTLYRIADTRIIGIYIPEGTQPVDIFADRSHATGSVSSAAGLKHGTDPDALIVYVPHTGKEAWRWLAKQTWIDIVSTSYFTVLDSTSQHATCPAREAIRQIAQQGRLVFSSAGNVETIGPSFAPSGVPEAYQVGGVDESGRTYLPGSANRGESITPTRPYETGDRFDFPSADSESLDGSMRFGGTSGATPSTAGRAAELLQTARSILGSTWTGVRNKALAIATSKARVPDNGPLADGRLERDEFIDLLHHVAIPAEPPTPLRYFIEGFGALNDRAVADAKKVLLGQMEEPRRPDEDAAHGAVEEARQILFPAPRCG